MTRVSIGSDKISFHERKCIWKYSLRNVGHFVQGEMSYSKYSHYRDVIMSAMASQITSQTIVYSTVYSGADQRKRQSSASLAFVRGIHRSPMNSPHKRPVTRKMSPFDDVIMVSLKKKPRSFVLLCFVLVTSSTNLFIHTGDGLIYILQGRFIASEVFMNDMLEIVHTTTKLRTVCIMLRMFCK